MSRTYATQLDQEHATVGFDHEFLSILRSRNLKIQIEELWQVGTIKPGEENSGYILAVVSHLTAPIEEVDLADTERKETLVCGCKGFYFNSYDREIGAKVEDCKHCSKVKQKRRTDAPDEQETLV
jgi:hypothetical protein